MNRADQLIEEMNQLGAEEVFDTSKVSGDKILYCITNGPNILTIGQGEAIRLQCLMRGHTCNRKHKKNFVIAASNKIHGTNHRYFYLQSSEAEEKENRLHSIFGKIHLNGHPNLNVNESSTLLFNSIVEKILSQVSTGFIAALEVASLEGDALPVLYKLEKYLESLDLAFDGYFSH